MKHMKKKNNIHQNTLLIPDEDFIDVAMTSYQIRSFYIFMDSASLQYSSGVAVGQQNVRDNAIIVLEGAGLTHEVPFDDINYGGSGGSQDQIFQPRSFNGAILYVGKYRSCPSSSPITAMPSILKFSESSLIFSFALDHDYEINEFHHSKMNKIISDTILEVLETDDILKIMVNEYNLSLKTVNFFEKEGKCVPSSNEVGCTLIDAQVQLSYFSSLDRGYVYYYMINYAELIRNNINDNDIKVNYIGDQAVETNLRFTLTGVPNKKMNQDESIYFEEVTKKFVDETVKKKSDIDVLFVQITKQNIATVASERHLGVRIEVRKKLEKVFRTLQEIVGETNLIKSAIEIETIITGKYNPPPQIDFDRLVEDSINADINTFTKHLKNSAHIANGNVGETTPAYFEIVEKIDVKRITTMTPTATPTALPTVLPHNKSNLNMNDSTSVVILAVSIVGALLFVLIIIFSFIYFRHRNSNNSNNQVKLKPENSNLELYSEGTSESSGVYTPDTLLDAPREFDESEYTVKRERRGDSQKSLRETNSQGKLSRQSSTSTFSQVADESSNASYFSRKRMESRKPRSRQREVGQLERKKSMYSASSNEVPVSDDEENSSVLTPHGIHKTSSFRSKGLSSRSSHSRSSRSEFSRPKSAISSNSDYSMDDSVESQY